MPEISQQSELPLEAPPLPEGAPLLPARMVNEYVYCPRLAYLEWVQGEWAESADTVAGAYAHRRVDREDRPLPPAEELHEAAQPRTRSVTLSSPRLGLIARIDLVESDGDTVVPVDYKRGKRPHVPAGAYEPERVQLCIQGLLLEENGYHCTEGVLYYADSRERVRVVFDDDLRATTRRSVAGLRLVAASGRVRRPTPTPCWGLRAKPPPSTFVPSAVCSKRLPLKTRAARQPCRPSGSSGATDARPPTRSTRSFPSPTPC